MIQDWIQKLNDPSRDVYERRYRLLSAISISMLFLWLLVALAADGFSLRILVFSLCELLFIPTMVFTLRSGKIQLGAGGSAVVLVFFMLPFAFFYNGGIYAGAPNWCIIAMVFVTLTVRGKLRNFLLASDFLVTVVCYILAWKYPQLVASNTALSAFVDSLFSLIITGTLISTMFLFQLHMARQERQKLEAQQKEILELNRAQNRFFSSMSHEIRTPVNTIVGLNEMILRENVSAEVAEDAEQVRAASKMLLHLINDILDMSKLESGRMEMVQAPYSLSDLLTDVVGMLSIRAREKSLDFHVDVDPDLPAELVGDEMRIKQILINVLNNAFKYTEKGSVTLSVQQKKGENGALILVFTVRDTGIGIKKESIPYLFSAFKRVDLEQNRYIEGTGLGLAIVKQFVDLMGGDISVNSVYTHGSTFVIELPQSSVGTETLGEIQMGTRSLVPSALRYTPHFEAPEAKVLLVDDNAANRMVTLKLLRETRMQIDTAQNGEEALQRTLRTAYHLILMDHVMPVMDGVTCLKLLRTQTGGLSKEAKVVALTANVDSGSRRFYATEGFDGYLVKPCSGDAVEEECVRLLPPELVQRTRAEREILEDSISWMTEREKREEIVITTDSIADIPDAVIQKYRIGVVPHIVHTEEGNFRDGIEIEASGLVEYMADGDRSAKTIPPTPAEYEAFFARQLHRANQVIHISISSQIRGSGFSAAKEAAGAFDNVTVVDSAHLSSGEGLLVLEACRLVQEGLEAEDIVDRLETVKKGIHTSFIVDSLDFLERANLVNRQIAKISNALMIRPLLRLKRGEIKIGRIFLGSREASWKQYISRELNALTAIDRRVLFVTYVGLSQRDLSMIRIEIEKRGQFDAVYFQKASPAIAVNCGPGTFGLLFQEKPASI